jgi:microcin C transport system ATP-binding protein
VNEPLLEIRDLAVDFNQSGTAVHAVRGVDLDIRRGEIVGIVGESGSGKSVTALSVLQLLRGVASYPRGSIRLHGGGEALELMGAPEARMRAIRGNRISMVFQEPMTSLNPLHTIHRQIAEAMALHGGPRGAAARDVTAEWLERVGLREARKRLDAYPHQLSGGQRQRVMIAMALVNRPDLLIADEPTTALDVTIQAQILELFASLQKSLGMAMLWITHDLGLVRRIADRVAVMQGGRVVETGPCARVFEAPEHPYTQKLVGSAPSGSPPPVPPEAAEVLAVDGLKVHFPVRAGLLRRTVSHIRAVDGVAFRLREGMSLGIVGESGSGKTTVALAVLRLIARSAADLHGSIVFAGKDLAAMSSAAVRPLRRNLQVVFQDPFGSLSPRMPVGAIVGEGLELHRPDLDAAGRDAEVADTLRRVELDPEARHRYPHEFSGGQRQRIALARALVLRPKVLVLDEPTSALDLTLQKEILDLLRALQARERIAYVFISHDLRVIRAVCHEVLVMRHGRVVEQGPADRIFRGPGDDYTRALLAAAFEFKAIGKDAA